MLHLKTVNKHVFYLFLLFRHPFLKVRKNSVSKFGFNFVFVLEHHFHLNMFSVNLLLIYTVFPSI